MGDLRITVGVLKIPFGDKRKTLGTPGGSCTREIWGNIGNKVGDPGYTRMYPQDDPWDTWGLPWGKLWRLLGRLWYTLVMH